MHSFKSSRSGFHQCEAAPGVQLLQGRRLLPAYSVKEYLLRNLTEYFRGRSKTFGLFEMSIAIVSHPSYLRCHHLCHPPCGDMLTYCNNRLIDNFSVIPLREGVINYKIISLSSMYVVTIVYYYSILNTYVSPTKW